MQIRRRFSESLSLIKEQRYQTTVEEEVENFMILACRNSLSQKKKQKKKIFVGVEQEKGIDEHSSIGDKKDVGGREEHRGSMRGVLEEMLQQRTKAEGMSCSMQMTCLWMEDSISQSIMLLTATHLQYWKEFPSSLPEINYK